MVLILAALFITAAIYLILYQFKFIKPNIDKAHLPPVAFKDEFSQDVKAYSESYFHQDNKKLFSLSNRFKDYESKLSTTSLTRRLIKAGSPLGVIEFFVFRAITLVLIPVFAYLLLADISPRKDILLIIALALGYFAPDIWLNKKIERRQSTIRKELPNIIDLLNLCVSGGLDFMMAVNRVVKDLKPSPLTTELAEVYRLTQIGKTRKEALKNFAWRVDVPEGYSFVRTLVQADRMGTPMADALKMQSEEMRVRRFQRGEAMALKAPIKLLLPLFVFILPVVLILVAGPILLQFQRGTIGF